MFYSEAILSRRGPLAKVWLAAHMERKLSKTQTLQTDIEQSVGAIMGQEVEVMALRLSGQLLLGVVRIYSRKAKYLLDDCNEALLKIKMAFRPGIVDMTEDQLAVNRNAITLQGGDIDLDLLLPDINWDVDFEERPLQPQGQHVARMADITLATANDLPFDLDDPGYGFDLGPSDGIGSQDFDLDLGLDFGDGPVSVNGNEDMSVEVGRDAPVSRLSIDSRIMGDDAMDVDLDVASNRSKSRGASEHPFGPDLDLDFGQDFAGIDLNLGVDFGEKIPPSDREKTPGQTRASSRASSPLTEIPETPPPEGNIPEPTPKAKRKYKEQKQIIDAVTELKDGPGPRINRGGDAELGAPLTKDVSNILTGQHFLPRSSVVMRLLEIRDDPLAHFLPTKVTPNGTFFCVAPPGLAPELSDMFLHPVHNALLPKRRGHSPEKGANKRLRLDGTGAGDDEIEIARRAGSLAPSGLGSDILGRGSIGPGPDLEFGDNTGIGMDDYQMDLGGDAEMGGGLERARSKSAAPTDRSRLSTPAPDGIPIEDGDENYADATCPIAMFDIRPSQSQEMEQETDAVNHDGRGYSKNTIKALGIIRKELQPVADEEGQDKMISFRKISDKASRRAAASFFFELLVLGTRDCIHLSQAAAHENIEVRAKDKLWERLRHSTPGPSQQAEVPMSSQQDNEGPPRQRSVSPSIASSMGL